MNSVMMCGGDPTLLSVRAAVLRQRSFKTTMVIGVDRLKSLQMENAPDLIVLCNSLKLVDRVEAHAVVTERFPGKHVITLLRGGESDCLVPGLTLPISAGPQALVDTALQLTRVN
jgi:hypothetical protein